MEVLSESSLSCTVVAYFKMKWADIIIILLFYILRPPLSVVCFGRLLPYDDFGGFVRSFVRLLVTVRMYVGCWVGSGVAPALLLRLLLGGCFAFRQREGQQCGGWSCLRDERELRRGCVFRSPLIIDGTAGAQGLVLKDDAEGNARSWCVGGQIA